MPERDQWSPADDESVRGALDTLRWETERVPLADVRFVKARGNARHRRAQLVGSLSVAAAVAAFGFIGFHSIGSNQSLDVGPAATSSTPAPTPTKPAIMFLLGGPLPVAAEWSVALGLTETVRMTDMRPGEGVWNDCPVGPPGAQRASGSVHLARSSWLDAAQGTYRATSADAGNAAAATAVSQLVGCQQMKVKVEAEAAWPKVFSTVTPGADSQSWYIVAHEGALTSLIVVTESGPTSPHHQLAQIRALGLVAQQRLVQEVKFGPITRLTLTTP